MASLSANCSNLNSTEVQNPANDIQDQLLHDLAWGPLNLVQTFPIYFVNGYCFHTSNWAQNQKTNNSRVSLSGEETVYHGIVEEIIDIKYPGLPIKRLTLFNCKWFDPSCMGTRICPIYGTVEVKSNRRYKGKDTFIFTQQSEQVYFTPYPNLTSNRRDWLLVIKTKSRRTIQSLNVPFQDDDGSHLNDVSFEDEIDVALRDFNDRGEEVNHSIEEHVEEEELLDESEDSESEEDIPTDYYIYSD
ncbi:hypothetical protein DH2020_018937 [Rehmannia glutinosa]|uniref:DUF4216 domain-containing protein n=1 Tax=Rehmannia glutinosa TaxID=99300 RepID=A0ABR0WLJ0_REHGL